MTIHQLPKRQDVRLSSLRLSRRPKADVIRITRNVDTLYRLACTIDASEPERGEAMYQAVLFSHPSHARAMVNLGNLRFRAGKYEEAKTLYQHARTCDPMMPEAAYNLGYLALEEGELSDALNLLEIAVKLDPTFDDAKHNLAVAKQRAARAMGESR